MKNKLLELIRRNRISSVEVADALGKTDNTAILSGLLPLNPGNYVAGELWYIATWANSNWPLHEQLQDMPPNVVVFVEGIQCDNRALLGDLVAKTACLYGGARGLLVDGLVRDVHRLRKENFPIWCKGRTPLGCFNNNVSATSEIEAHVSSQNSILKGALVVADDSGCTIVEESLQTQDLYDRLEFIEIQEDIWYFCIDTLKMSTYETICKKVYLDNPDILPRALYYKLAAYNEKNE